MREARPGTWHLGLTTSMPDVYHVLCWTLALSSGICLFYTPEGPEIQTSIQLSLRTWDKKKKQSRRGRCLACLALPPRLLLCPLAHIFGNGLEDIVPWYFFRGKNCESLGAYNVAIRNWIIQQQSFTVAEATVSVSPWPEQVSREV